MAGSQIPSDPNEALFDMACEFVGDDAVEAARFLTVFGMVSEAFSVAPEEMYVWWQAIRAHERAEDPEAAARMTLLAGLPIATARALFEARHTGMERH